MHALSHDESPGKFSRQIPEQMKKFLSNPPDVVLSPQSRCISYVRERRGNAFVSETPNHLPI